MWKFSFKILLDLSEVKYAVENTERPKVITGPKKEVTKRINLFY